MSSNEFFPQQIPAFEDLDKVKRLLEERNHLLAKIHQVEIQLIGLGCTHADMKRLGKKPDILDMLKTVE